MNHRKKLWLGLVAGLALPSISWAQVAAVPAGLAAPAPAATSNLWSFLLPNADQKAACKTHFCNSVIGQFTSAAITPLSSMSGGLLQNRCLLNKIADDIKNKPADDPDGLAARVKKDEIEAKARRASVRFLGTADCNYWPEAIDALKTALRKDRSECVRFEAALALGNGCCCNKEIIDALKNSVLGDFKTDPNPVERSDRVRAAAAEALSRCVNSMPPEIVPETKDKIKKAEAEMPTPAPGSPADYYKRLAATPHEQVVASARAVLVSMKKGGKLPAEIAANRPANTPAPTIPGIPQRPTSLTGIVANAFSPPTSTAAAPIETVNEARAPFFTGITKSLTGKQEYLVPARQPYYTPSGNGIVTARETIIVVPDNMPRPSVVRTAEPRTIVTTEILPPAPPMETPIVRVPDAQNIVPVKNVREEIPIVPADDAQVPIPLEIVPATPIIRVPDPRSKGGVEIVQPAPTRDAKATSVEIIQPAPSSAPMSERPRETSGVVTIEVMPTAQPNVTPGSVVVPRVVR